jgi:hypothetical protein
LSRQESDQRSLLSRSFELLLYASRGVLATWLVEVSVSHVSTIKRSCLTEDGFLDVTAADMLVPQTTSMEVIAFAHGMRCDRMDVDLGGSVQHRDR